MLAQLRHDLTSVFMDRQDFSPQACSAANVLFYRLSQSPYFEGGNNRFFLARSGPDFYEVFGERYDDEPCTLDPLRYCYRDEAACGDENGSCGGHALLLYPTREMSAVSPAPFTGQLPSAVEEKVRVLHQGLLRHHAQYQMWPCPTPEQLASRHQILMESFQGVAALHQRLQEVLGRHYDRNLVLDGIRYHQPAWGSNANQRYILAHNGKEVAGLIRYVQNKHVNGLAFVSVSPGFRGQGMSQKLYQVLMDECVEEKCVLRRSDPGKFAHERPAITACYDRLVKESSVLHVIGHRGYLQGALVAKLESHPYEEVASVGKAWCDQALHRERERANSHGAESIEHEACEGFKAQWDQLHNKSAPSQQARSRSSRSRRQ